MCVYPQTEGCEWGSDWTQHKQSPGPPGEGWWVNRAVNKTYDQRRRRWCWDSFLPAPASLSSGYSSQLLLGSACQPEKGKIWGFSHRRRPAATSVNQLEPLDCIKSCWVLNTERLKRTERISITGFWRKQQENKNEVSAGNNIWNRSHKVCVCVCVRPLCGHKGLYHLFFHVFLIVLAWID